jgi:hypothetical protein
MVDRRTFCAGAAAAALLPLTARDALAQGAAAFQMWHSPGCGCCLEWARRIQAEFRRPLRVIETADMAALKRASGIPANLQSCHTARVAGVLVEGHVPPADIRRLIQSGNPRRLGLAVPGMPAGSPGMDVGHNHRQPYSVFAFDARGGRSVFARHGG